MYIGLLMQIMWAVHTNSDLYCFKANYSTCILISEKYGAENEALNHWPQQRIEKEKLHTDHGSMIGSHSDYKGKLKSSNVRLLFWKAAYL